MAVKFKVKYLEIASPSVFNPVGSIFLGIRHRLQKVCLDLFNGEATVLEDDVVSEHRLPQIDIPSDALELPSSLSLFIRNALLNVDLDTRLREYIQKKLTDKSVELSRGGRGFCLGALVEAVNVQLDESASVDRAVKKVLSILVIKKLLKQGMENPVDVKQVEGCCAVCLEELKTGNESEDVAKLIVMPCSHVFHKKCIFLWLKKINSCPVCRRAVELEPADFDALPDRLFR